MDRLEIKLLAIFFCTLVIGLRLPGIFWPEKLRAFLSHYKSLGNAVVKFIGVLFICLGLAILIILFKTITLTKIVVLIGGVTLLGSGTLHFYPEILKKILTKIEKRSPSTLRIISILSVSLAIGIGIYVLMRD